MKDILTLFEEIIVDSISFLKTNNSEDLELLERDLSTPDTPFKVYNRIELEDRYGDAWETMASHENDPIWVTNIPREFYDFEEEQTGEWRNFDLFLPEGYGEAISGGEREYEYNKILKKIERAGLDKDNFNLILKLAKEEKLKPSAGAGLGIERFLRYICGTKHVADVQVFPRVPGIVTEL